MSLAAKYNETRTRSDCEWIDTPDGGVMLVQTREWTQNYTKQLERKAESERRDWMHRQKYPVQ